MPGARQLRRLNLRDNRITDRGAIALAECDHLDDLELLDLRDNRIGYSARQRLRDRFDHDDCRLLLGNGGPP
jgi:Ran GTPase-activating protein (RanGAP) involved in mRNA processing and transport